ncbi:MAG: hypothetical protein U9N59_02030 [Campylobacterota bacterium]|nr:hypothetical protein [Campylobacterota bacterium]
MLVTLDIKNESMKDSFLNFVRTLDYIDIKSDTLQNDKQHKNNKDKFSQFAGMWENSDINIDSIREKAWKR